MSSSELSRAASGASSEIDPKPSGMRGRCSVRRSTRYTTNPATITTGRRTVSISIVVMAPSLPSIISCHQWLK